MSQTREELLAKIEPLTPEGYADVSALASAQRLGFDDLETRRKLFIGLQEIERGVPIVVWGGSTDSEELIARQGTVALGWDGRWRLRDQEVQLGMLWERHPKLRPYLERRGRLFVHRQREELALSEQTDNAHARWLHEVIEHASEELRLVGVED